ncbi:MAG TPA: Mut7-C RNAse domain-containing protein, partial [Anaerolineales bacterium]
MQATFTFIDQLNDFLPRSRKNSPFLLEFAPHQSLKHLIESLGVPHTELGQVLVDDQASDASNRLQDGARVTVYPADSPLEGEPCFILDNHLGQLATYLRMLGFDCLYRN